MAADLTQLVDPFQVHIKSLLGDLLRQGYDLRPFFTLRDPWTQAKLWRQSRTTQEIHEKAGFLAREGAPWLREVLLSVGSQEGRWATNALPGQSWHQWGEAVDCYVQEAGRAVWRRTHPGYEKYAELAQRRGLEAGFYWKQMDAVHVQLRSERVLKTYTWAEIDAEMKERFSSVTDVTEEKAQDALPNPSGDSGLRSLTTEGLVAAAERDAAQQARRRT